MYNMKRKKCMYNNYTYLFSITYIELIYFTLLLYRVFKNAPGPHGVIILVRVRMYNILFKHRGFFFLKFLFIVGLRQF